MGRELTIPVSLIYNIGCCDVYVDKTGLYGCEYNMWGYIYVMIDIFPPGPLLNVVPSNIIHQRNFISNVTLYHKKLKLCSKFLFQDFYNRREVVINIFLCRSFSFQGVMHYWCKKTLVGQLCAAMGHCDDTSLDGGTAGSLRHGNGS